MITVNAETNLTNNWLRARAWLAKKAPMVILGALMVGVVVVMMPDFSLAAAKGVDEIGTSISKLEEPVQELFKKIGSTALFVVLGLCGLYQFFGNEWTRRAKGMAITGVVGTAILYNLPSLRDFITGVF